MHFPQVFSTNCCNSPVRPWNSWLPICLQYKWIPWWATIIIQTGSPSLMHFEIYAKMAFWPLTLTPGKRLQHQMNVQIWFLICLQYKWSLHPLWIWIFIKIAYLTFDLDPRSKVITPNESPYMTCYMSTIQLESLTLMVFEIVEEKCLFDLSRSSEVKGQGRTTKKIIPYSGHNKYPVFWNVC